jgi:hypothetical protein
MLYALRLFDTKAGDRKLMKLAPNIIAPRGQIFGKAMLRPIRKKIRLQKTQIVTKDK